MALPATPASTAAHPAGPSAAATRLHGRWLLLARVAWLAMAASCLGLFAVGIPAQFAHLQNVCTAAACPTWDFASQLPPEGVAALADLGFSIRGYAAYAVALDVIVGVGFSAVAAVLFWCRSADRMALFTALALLTFGTATFTAPLVALMLAHPAWGPPVAVANFLGAASFGLFLFVFPDGRFVPRWTRWVALAWIAWQVPKYLSPAWDTTAVTGLPAWLSLLVWPGALGTAIYAQAFRYRRVSGAAQRQQTKWVILGIAAALTTFVCTDVARDVLAPEPASPGGMVALLIKATLSYLAILLIPLSIGIAMLRVHLFDVDLLINRALVYGALTVSIAGLYVLVVGGLGAMLQARGSPLIALLATGLVAVIVQPLRARLQRGVNRLLYGERDEPYAVLSRLGQRLEATLAPEAVLPAVVETVAGALKLPFAAITLRCGERFILVAAHGSPVGEILRLPLGYQAETIGELLLAPRGPGESFSPSERHLLDDLARQAGAAAHAVWLTSELQRSRERLVATREEERRRLRRDLHDGLGPQLAALTLKLETARNRLAHDPVADALLAELAARTQTAVANIRRVVYGLRPPALDELGLVATLREATSQHSAGGLAITVEAPERLPPLPAAAEVAAYRITLEALTNVVRHAAAHSCTIRLALDETAGVLCLEIADDGRGLAAARPAGVGLAAMRERAEELGGYLAIESTPETGTRVRARLPCGTPTAPFPARPEPATSPGGEE